MVSGKSMRVLFDEQIFSNQRFGGISRYYSELVKAMEANQVVSAKLLSPLCTNHHAREVPKTCRVGIPFPEIKCVEKYVRYVNKKFAARFIDYFKPDILHQTYYPYRDTPRRSNLRIVTTVYDMIHELFPLDFEDSYQISRLKLRAVRRADLVICISENTRKDLIDLTGIDHDKTVVIHLGVDHMQNLPLETPANSSRPFLLYVGLRDTYKNFERVLKAYAKSPELKSHFDLVCFGGGALSQKEKNLITKLKIPDNKIIMTGGADSVLAGLYRRASAFLYPSLYEGFGIPPLEAMVHGCPVISSQSSSLPEVLGGAAEYFNPGDSDDLINAITRVVFNQERAEELTRLGSAHVQMYTWQRCADQTLLAYQGILKI